MSNLNDIDKIISDSMNQPSLIDAMQEESERKTARKMAWAGEMQQYWYIYLLLVISGVFTATLGLFMGLSPSLVTDPATGAQFIHFNTDLTHILLAVLYMVSFVGVTELQFAISKRKFNDREEGNPAQSFTMLAAMGIAVVGIIGTGIAGGMVVASNIAFLTDFREIPHAAQKWVIVVIPCMLAIYSILYTVYALSSEHAKAERLTRDAERRARLDHETRIRNAQLVAERALQEEEIKAYWRLVNDGKLDAGEAKAAIRAGKTLGQLEKEKGKDLDGNGTVGTVAPRRSAAKNTNLVGDDWDIVDRDSEYALPCGHIRGVKNNWQTGGYECRVCGKPVAINNETREKVKSNNGSKPDF